MVQIQGSKLGMRKGYHLSVEGIWKAGMFSVKNGVCKPHGGLPPHASNLNTWAQLFKGRLALNPGLNLTLVSFSCVQKHFLR